MEQNPFAGMDPDAMLDALRRQAEELETKASQLRSELDNAGTTATSPDGAVTVTVSATGALQDISFSAKAAAHGPEALGPLVMRTVQAAQREVSSRVSAAVSGQFGDAETMGFVQQFMPAPDQARARHAKRDDDEEFGGVLRKRPGRTEGA